MYSYCDILSVNHNNFNLDGTNYEEDDPDIIFHIKLFAWQIKLEKREAFTKSK